jgi:hypothetical protein
VIDFIPESDTDDTSDEDDAPHATRPAADATRFYMENAYLNTGANAKGMYALFYII